MSRVEVSYDDFHRFQMTTKRITKKLISIMRLMCDVDQKFIDDMIMWINQLNFLVTIVNPELQSSVINNVCVVRCAFANLAIFGNCGVFSSHLYNVVAFIEENEVEMCRDELRYLIATIEIPNYDYY